MDKTLRIILHTLQDQLQRRSFHVLLAVSIFFVLMLRGCYDASYTINGQPLSGAEIARQASLFAFHLVAGGMLLLSVLIATPVFPTDQEDGSMVLYLSRPVSRSQYLMGRLLGIWLLASAFMFALHAAVFLIAWQKTGLAIPGFLAASLLCSINLLFVVTLTSLLSFFMPGFTCAAAVMLIIFIGFVSDGGQRLLDSTMGRAVLHDAAARHAAWWRLLYPKLYMVQHYAATVINGDEFHHFGPVHPLVNVLLYCAALTAMLFFAFQRKEI
jgi:ABC-type transport system involved in multi-copper enzyme maturation permease subunit